MFTQDQKYSRMLVVFLIALAAMLSACGGQVATTPQEVAPVEKAPVEAVAVPEAEFDLVASVDEYMTGIPEGYMGIKLDGLKQLMESGNAVVIDVREVAEYEAGHIPGAINIPLRTLAQNLDQVPTDTPTVVYCKSGHRAAMAVSALHMLGYENSRAYGASYKGWTAAEEPVTTDMVVADTYTVPEIQPEMMAAVDEFLSGIPEGFLAMGDIEKLNEAIDNGAFLLDVREEKEFVEGHLPGAINIPIRTVAHNLDQIPTDRPVFVYCKSGYRAAVSMAALQTMGYSNVKSFPPGFTGWVNAGQPLAALQ